LLAFFEGGSVGGKFGGWIGFDVPKMGFLKWQMFPERASWPFFIVSITHKILLKNRFLLPKAVFQKTNIHAALPLKRPIKWLVTRLFFYFSVAVKAPALQFLTLVLQFLTLVFQFLSPAFQSKTPVFQFFTPALQSKTPVFQFFTLVFQFKTLAFEFFTLVFQFKTLAFEFFTPVFKSKTQALQSGNSDFEVWELQIGVFFG
jgi:hypothetical protein